MSVRAIAAVAAGACLLGGSAIATAQPPPPAKALVVVTGEGLDAPTARALIELADLRLRQDGLRVVDAPDLKGPQQLDAALGQKVRAVGADRLFVLQVVRFSSKVFYQLEERDVSGQQVLFAASLTGTLDDADVLLPRLVDAVLQRQSAADGHEPIGAAGAAEDRSAKKPGENNFVIGLPFGLTNGGGGASAGLSLGYLYEAETFGIGFTGLLVGGSHGLTGLLEFHGLYYFMPGDWSPYLDGGLGYVAIQQSSSSGTTYGRSGIGATAEFGVEFLRLSRIHLQASLEGVFPFYTVTASSFDNFTSSYTPAVLLNLRIAF